MNQRAASLAPPELSAISRQPASAAARPSREPYALRRGRGQELPEVDLETLRQAREGDRTAQEAFVRCYEHRVHAFLGRSLIDRPDVDDLAQEVFLRVLRALPRFEIREGRVSTWILSIAVRLLIDKKRRGWRWFLPWDDDRVHAGGPNPEQGAIDRETLTEVERILLEQSPEQRMALALVEFHGLSHDEAALAMNSTVATLKTRIWRARRALRARVQRTGGPPKGEAR